MAPSKLFDFANHATEVNASSFGDILGDMTYTNQNGGAA